MLGAETSIAGAAEWVVPSPPDDHLGVTSQF